jgi:2-polyprenyl-3-methyl-5-hydroxy-6-metoxy-1,4-benzoquinol methylase
MPMQLDQEMIRYYTNSRTELNRLNTGSCQLEKARTQEIILPYLCQKSLKILDVGGATGVYSFWLSEMGHEVHLIDPVPLHVEEARKYSMQSKSPLASINMGEARGLEFEDSYFDIVLLLGPLYHLTQREERIAALLESKRVVKMGGVIFSGAISRYAAMLDGFIRGLITNPGYIEAMQRSLKNGQHRNEKEIPGNFVTAYCHQPAELEKEALEAGLKLERLVAIEGFGWLMPDFDSKWTQPDFRKLLLCTIKTVEEDGSLLGMSGHIMAITRKQ